MHLPQIRRKTSATILALLGTLGFYSARAFAGTENPMQLVQASLDANDRLGYIGEIETLRFRGGRAEATIVRVEHRPPNLTRRWYLAPPSLFGDSVIIRDHEIYEIDRRRHLVIHGQPHMHHDFGEAMRARLIEHNYRAELGAQSLIAGHRVREISLFEKASDERVVSLWVDELTGLPLQRENFSTAGSIVYRMRYTSLKYTNAVPEAIFSTAIPTGYHAQDHGSLPSEGLAQAAMAHLPVPPTHTPEPHHLPFGFVLIGMAETSVGGQPARHLMYSDGIRTLSLFESSSSQPPAFANRHPEDFTIGSTTAHYLEDGSDGLLTWKSPDHNITLVGSLSAQELLQIAKALP